MTDVKRCFGLLQIACLAIAVATVRAAEGITWRATAKSVDAEVRDWPLPRLLENIAGVTGWEIFVEPGTERIATVVFTRNSPEEALKKLLGNINYSLTTPTNGVPRLFVYRTSAGGATQLVSPALKTAAKAVPGPIPNELIVALKPGSLMKIEELAGLLGAKVVGRIDGLNAFRLQFDDAAAANAARDSLAQNPDVAGVDTNFAVDRPPPVDTPLAGNVPAPKLKLEPPPASGRITVGLIDTAVQPLGGDLNAFLLPGVSVAGDPGQLPSTPTHGTAMAETILRALALANNGAASTVIQPYDVYGPNAMTTTFDVATGIYKAVNAGANPINLSLGASGDSSFLHNLIQQAAAKGIIFIAAAGNEPVTTPTYPAAYPEVTAVTAGDLQGHVASYANRGDFVDVVAPGSSVVNLNGQSYFVTGTSAATAFTTGAVVARAERTGEPLISSLNQFLQSAAPAAKR